MIFSFLSIALDQGFPFLPASGLFPAPCTGTTCGVIRDQPAEIEISHLFGLGCPRVPKCPLEGGTTDDRHDVNSPGNQRAPDRRIGRGLRWTSG
jgi:hypothetical protein